MKAHYRLIKFSDKYRLIVRNHWSKNYNDNFIIQARVHRQSYDLKVYQFGLINFNLCLMKSKI